MAATFTYQIIKHYKGQSTDGFIASPDVRSALESAVAENPEIYSVEIRQVSQENLILGRYLSSEARAAIDAWRETSSNAEDSRSINGNSAAGHDARFEVYGEGVASDPKEIFQFITMSSAAQEFPDKGFVSAFGPMDALEKIVNSYSPKEGLYSAVIKKATPDNPSMARYLSSRAHAQEMKGEAGEVYELLPGANEIVPDSKQLLSIIGKHGWQLYDLGMNAVGYCREEDEGDTQEEMSLDRLQVAGPVSAVEMGHQYLFIPMPGPGQSLREAYAKAQGIGPCLYIGDKERPDKYWTSFFAEYHGDIGLSAIFTRIAFSQLAYVTSAGIANPDLLTMPIENVVRAFENDFRIIKTGDLFLPFN